MRGIHTMKACSIATIAGATLAMTIAQSSYGQSRQIPAPVQSKTVIIHDATIHTVSGKTITNGYVSFANGVITDISEGQPPQTDGAILRDAAGLHVYPGLIAADTNLGLTETGAVDVTHDFDEFGNFTPEARAVIAINPDSELLPVARANGILTALTNPSGGLVSGRCSIIRLDGWTWEDLAINDNAGLVVNWPRTDPFGGRRFFRRRSNPEDFRKQLEKNLLEIEKLFDESLAYAQAKEADAELETDLRFEAMRPFVLGEKSIFVHASSTGQIESAVAWAQRRGLKIIIVGGTQADRVTSLLVEYDIPVIIGGLHRLPGARHADYDEAFKLPLNLHEAGVRFCLASGAGAAHERNLNHVAATSAAYGLDRDVALKSVTLYAAEILGIGETHGSIETGKAATLIVTSGDPLEITTDVILAFIDGREIDLGNRHKALYEKYREKYRQLGLID